MLGAVFAALLSLFRGLGKTLHIRMNNRRKFLIAAGAMAAGVSGSRARGEESWRRLPLQVASDAVAPWTGVVLRDSNERLATDAIQLEYSPIGTNGNERRPEENSASTRSTTSARPWRRTVPTANRKKRQRPAFMTRSLFDRRGPLIPRPS
jgi:hypothetical protein